MKLNDSLILQSENMFLESRIDVEKYLRKNENKLEITFHPTSELIEKIKTNRNTKIYLVAIALLFVKHNINLDGIGDQD